ARTPRGGIPCHHAGSHAKSTPHPTSDKPHYINFAPIDIVGVVVEVQGIHSMGACSRSQADQCAGFVYGPGGAEGWRGMMTSEVGHPYSRALPVGALGREPHTPAGIAVALMVHFNPDTAPPVEAHRRLQRRAPAHARVADDVLRIGVHL